MTAAEELVKVDAAIARILDGGQAHSSEGRMTQRAQLKDLYARKKELEHQLKSEARGGRIIYAAPSP